VSWLGDVRVCVRWRGRGSVDRSLWLKRCSVLGSSWWCEGCEAVACLVSCRACFCLDRYDSRLIGMMARTKIAVKAYWTWTLSSTLRHLY